MGELVIPKDKKIFKISEAAKILNVKPHVLRYWETEFPEVRPRKSYSGQRVYYREDILKIAEIRDLLYKSKFSIAGARQEMKRKKVAEPVVETVEENPIETACEEEIEVVENTETPVLIETLSALSSVSPEVVAELTASIVTEIEAIPVQEELEFVMEEEAPRLSCEHVEKLTAVLERLQKIKGRVEQLAGQIRA